MSTARALRSPITSPRPPGKKRQIYIKQGVMQYCNTTMVRPLSEDPSETITIRVSPAMKKELERLVERGLYKNVSAATRAGLQAVIDQHEETAKDD